MLISELLLEAHLQSILKKSLKRLGTFEDVFGRDAEDAADALHDKTAAHVFVVAPVNAAGQSAVTSVVNSPTLADFGNIRVVRLGGSVRALVRNGKVYLGDYQVGRLVD